MKKILGISAYFHDSAAAIVVGGEIIAAAQEERFSRQKHTAEFPVNAIQYCLLEAGLTINELDAIVFYDKPFLKFERLLQTYYAFAPRGVISFLTSIPIWLKSKLFLKKCIYDGLMKVQDYDRKKIRLLFSEHHLSHSASAFFTSPFEDAAVLTIDGVGEWCTASISKGKGNNIKIIKEMEFPHSVGLLYSAFTYYLGFEVNSGEYKLMGLAPFGNTEAETTLKYIAKIKSEMINIKNDGSIWINQKYFDYAIGKRMTKDEKWNLLFGIKRRRADEKISQEHCNLALAIQTITEDIVVKMAMEAKRLTNSDSLCMAGGVALNCVANGKLQKQEIFTNVFIQPAAGDAGGAVGAALAVNYIYYGEVRRCDDINDKMQGSYLGPSYSSKEILQMNKEQKAIFKYYVDFTELTMFVAEELARGGIVGWFQGRMEFGPRALGNRSILGDPRNPKMQNILNNKIKYRETFRPFAPSILEEDQAVFFEVTKSSPYMLLVSPILAEQRLQVPEEYCHFDLFEKLGVERSTIPAVTHVDFSARIHTVRESINPKYYQLLKSFKKVSGIGILVNTSFNIKDEPIVCTPTDAYRCFMKTQMSTLVIGNFLYIRDEQQSSKRIG